MQLICIFYKLVWRTALFDFYFAGSKILPYLNMNSSNQQQLGNNSQQQNGWPGNYGQLQQQQKGKVQFTNAVLVFIFFQLNF